MNTKKSHYTYFALEQLCRVSKSYLLEEYRKAINNGQLPPTIDPHQLINQRLGQPIHLAPYKSGKKVLLLYLSNGNIFKKICESRLSSEEQLTTSLSLQYALGTEEIQEARYEILFNTNKSSPLAHSGVEDLLKILSSAERVARLNKSLIFYSRTTWQNNDPTIPMGITLSN